MRGCVAQAAESRESAVVRAAAPLDLDSAWPPVVLRIVPLAVARCLAVASRL